MDDTKQIFAFSSTFAGMTKGDVKALSQQEKELRKTRRGTIPSTKRNMVTNPGKKGTFGYAGTLFAERPESEYHPYREDIGMSN